MATLYFPCTMANMYVRTYVRTYVHTHTHTHTHTHIQSRYRMRTNQPRIQMSYCCHVAPLAWAPGSSGRADKQINGTELSSLPRWARKTKASTLWCCTYGSVSDYGGGKGIIWINWAWKQCRGHVRHPQPPLPLLAWDDLLIHCVFMWNLCIATVLRGQVIRDENALCLITISLY